MISNRRLSSQDHAAGALLVTEAGGVVSDSRGLPLDFGLGTTLGENFGSKRTEADSFKEVEFIGLVLQ